ncbi:MAG: N-acetyltransferase family protein [Archangium sp.]
MTLDILRASPTQARDWAPALGAVLRDCVAGGASVSFVEVPEPEEAAAFFGRVAEQVAADVTDLFVALKGDRPVGTVQLQAVQTPNQRHRGEVSKLLVHRDARGCGIARRLMQALERRVPERGLSLVVLDTRHGDTAERLYLELGWTPAGIIPEFARSTEGQLQATTVFYKRF